MADYEQTLDGILGDDVAALTAQAARACGKASCVVEYATRWLRLIRAELVAELREGRAAARRRINASKRARRGKPRDVSDWVLVPRARCEDGRGWLASVSQKVYGAEGRSVPPYELLVGLDEAAPGRVLVVLPARRSEARSLVRVRAFAAEGSMRPVDVDFTPGEAVPCMSTGSCLSAVARSRGVARAHLLEPGLRATICGGAVGPVPSGWDAPRPAAATHLNEAQERALIGVTGPLAVIVGPPGTGKSSFIAELIARRAPRASRCLCCCTTNKAVDSLVEKLSTAGQAVLAVGRLEAMGGASRARTLERLLRTDAAVAAATAAHMRAVNSRERREETLDALKKPAKGSKVVDGKEQNRGFVERSLGKLGSNKPKAALKRTPAVQRLADMVDGGGCKTYGELVACARAWLAKPLEGDAKRVALRAAARKLLDDAELVEDRAAAVLDDATASASAKLWRTSRVVCCTASAAASLPLRLARIFGEAAEDLGFDVVVLDEAAAMLEPDAVAALGHGAAACVLVGDPSQLPPFSKWRDARRAGYGISLLERCVAGRAAPVFRLEDQYRMHPAISEAVSEAFYGGALRTPPAVAATRPLDAPLHFVDFCHAETRDGASLSNAFEATAVVAVVKALVAHGGHDPRCVAVLCFYNAQRALVERKLRDAAVSGVLVASVDAAQGREADAVVVATTRSNKYNDLGFVADARRANVALSRARHVCVVLGDRACLETDSRAWRPYLRAADKCGLATHASAADFAAAFRATVPAGYAAGFPPPPEPPAPDHDRVTVDDLLRDGDGGDDAPDLAALSLAEVGDEADAMVGDGGWGDDGAVDEPPLAPAPEGGWDDAEDDGDGDGARWPELEIKVAKYAKKVKKAVKRGDEDEVRRLSAKLQGYEKKLDKALRRD